jgi:hypothetical protein
MGIHRASGVLVLTLVGLQGTEPKHTTAADCTFNSNPDEFLSRNSRIRQDVSDRLSKIDRAFIRRDAAADVPLPRRNFIDAEIFGDMDKAGVKPARLTTDEEFVRRIYLDITGRIPSPDTIRGFLGDTASDKRDALIDKLLYSPEFVDKWTVWLGDLLQNTANSSNVNRQLAGRDAFYNWIKGAVNSDKSIKDMAYEVVTMGGNTYYAESGAANFIYGGTTPMGPIQDTYDTLLVRSSTAFLGIAYYDCILCHNGRGHLDAISLWGSNATRAEAQLMASHFSRVRFNRNTVRTTDPLYNSTDVTDAAAGTYDLNTNYGNRPPRVPVGTLRSLTPQYRNGKTPSGTTGWRDAFAAQMVADPMFARNFANRLWKAMFNLGLVDPVDTMDPARTDVFNPPPAPWTLQASHPMLLQKLSEEFIIRNYSLREFLRVLAQSSAYQLSSRYDGEWKFEYIPLYARHYPRRLDAEEVADAIVTATGIPGGYMVGGWSQPVNWAMQLPEPLEPRNSGAQLQFLNTFLRGNRDTQQRSQSGSILQQLYLMNDQFVTNRTKVAASPTLMALSKNPDNTAVVNELFLLFLTRQPSDIEAAKALTYFAKANTPALRNSAIEDLAWTLINKLDFLFSY